MTRNSQVRLLPIFLLTIPVLIMPSPASAQVGVGVAVTIAPPELPVYDQPVCPGEGYIWTPGYWDWDGDDYFWVPGTWVIAPEPGFLWTPGYWAWGDRGFFFTAGYWGPVVGFYGGINYGFGYFGHGYEGGRWDNDHFFYNRAVNNVNVTVIHNTYNSTVTNTTVNRVSYNGGNGGISARPSREEEANARGRHLPPVAAQTKHVQDARSNKELRASVNHGLPPVAATPKPGAFKDSAVVRAREAGAVHGLGGRPAEANGSNPRPAFHPNELPKSERPASPNTGDAKLDQKYQKQQDKLGTQQAREMQNLQRQQDQEHARIAKQQANETQKQAMEQRHQQQTQQMQEKHAQQTQSLQTRQQPHAPNRAASPPPPQERR